LDTDPLPSLLIALDAINVAFGAPQIVALCFAGLALLLSAYVSGSEIAFFSISPQQADDMDDSEQSTTIRHLLNNSERLLATILIANNLVNVTIVVLTSYALNPLFAQLGAVANFLLQTVCLTFLILLFGEILPKLIANTSPMGWARFSAGGVNYMMNLLWPLSSILVSSTKIVNKVVTRKTRNITADELGQALEISDVENRPDKEMLQGILRFGDTNAAAIMTPRVDITGLDNDMTFSEVMDVIISKGYSRMPVFGESQDDIIGVLYARDVLPYIPKHEGEAPINGFKWQTLIRQPYFVPESRMIDDLLEDFRKLKIHIAIVVDEFGGTRGVVTLEDVLEEIVGDINDEYDDEEKTYRRLPDDTYIFEGKTLLNDFFRITGLDPDAYKPVAEDSETLAGMLLAIKGDFPKDKEPLVYDRCRFLILSIEHHRISSVRVKVMPDQQDA
jgi:gliding motility-associated protein GldE